MTNEYMKLLGTSISRLRIEKDLKQSELAFEAGVSERVLQRLEAGHVIKSDGLVKILVYLGVFDKLIALLSASQASPSALAKQVKDSAKPYVRKRIRRKSTHKTGNTEKKGKQGVGWIWPEDQQ